MDRDKVIKGLELCLGSIDSAGCPEECPYYEACQKYENYAVFQPLMRDALEALKAQEPVAPYMDYDGRDVWRCGNCGAAIFHLDHTQADEDTKNYVKFCWHCGKAVKWES